MAMMIEAPTEKRCIDHPQFWSYFMRCFSNAAIVGDVKGGAELVKSLAAASDIPAEAIVAKIKTHLLLDKKQTTTMH
jgi:hypothetical protein